MHPRITTLITIVATTCFAGCDPLDEPAPGFRADQVAAIRLIEGGEPRRAAIDDATDGGYRRLLTDVLDRLADADADAGRRLTVEVEDIAGGAMTWSVPLADDDARAALLDELLISEPPVERDDEFRVLCAFSKWIFTESCAIDSDGVEHCCVAVDVWCNNYCYTRHP